MPPARGLNAYCFRLSALGQPPASGEWCAAEALGAVLVGRALSPLCELPFLGRTPRRGHSALCSDAFFALFWQHFDALCRLVRTTILRVCVSAQISRSSPTSPTSSLPLVGAFAPVRTRFCIEVERWARVRTRCALFRRRSECCALTLSERALLAHRTPLSGAQLLLLDSGLPVGPSRNLSGSVSPPPTGRQHRCCRCLLQPARCRPGLRRIAARPYGA